MDGYNTKAWNDQNDSVECGSIDESNKLVQK